MLDLCCCAWAFSNWDDQGLLSGCDVQASHCGGFSRCGTQALMWAGFSSCGSWTLEHKLIVVVDKFICSVACGILSDQGSNPCLLHWQADSLPLSHQGSPIEIINLFNFSYSNRRVKWVKLLSCVRLFATPMNCSLPGSSVLGNFPGKSTGVGCHFLLHGIFPTQGSNPGLMHCG